MAGRNMKTTDRLKENPLYNLLIEIKDGGLDASSTLCELIHLKRDEQGSKYCMIPLDVSESKQATNIVIMDSTYQLSQHHVSMYEHYSDKRFGMTSYHYTATLINKDKKKARLHIYFNRFGEYQDGLLSLADDSHKNLMREHAESIMQLQSAAVMPILTELHSIQSRVEKERMSTVEKCQAEVDTASQSFFQTSKVSINSTQGKRYLRAIRAYIQSKINLNSVSLNPDYSTIRALKKTLVSLQKRKLSSLKFKKPKKVWAKNIEQSDSQATMIKSKNSDKKVADQKPKVVSESDGQNAFEEKLKELQQFNLNARDVNEIENCFGLLNECIDLVSNEDYSQVIQLFLDRDELVKRAYEQVTLCAINDDIDGIDRMLAICGSVDMRAISLCAIQSKVRPMIHLINKHSFPSSFLCSSSLTRANMVNYSVDVVRALLDAGGMVETTLLTNLSLLQHFAKEGKLEIVQLLVEHGAELDRQVSSELGMIITTERMQQAVEKYMDRVKVDAEGHTALMFAVENRHVAVARYLCEKGARLDLCTKSGFNALYFALTPRKNRVVTEEMVELFIGELNQDINSLLGPEGAQQTALHYAVADGDVDDVKILLKYGANPHVKRLVSGSPQNCISALQYAVGKGKISLLEPFLECTSEELVQKDLREIGYYFQINPQVEDPQSEDSSKESSVEEAVPEDGLGEEDFDSYDDESEWCNVM